MASLQSGEGSFNLQVLPGFMLPFAGSCSVATCSKGLATKQTARRFDGGSFAMLF
jgi:hypothetical protein